MEHEMHAKNEKTNSKSLNNFKLYYTEKMQPRKWSPVFLTLGFLNP